MMNRGFDGARIVSGDVDGDSSIRGFIETGAATSMIQLMAHKDESDLRGGAPGSDG